MVAGESRGYAGSRWIQWCLVGYWWNGELWNGKVLDGKVWNMTGKRMNLPETERSKQLRFRL